MAESNCKDCKDCEKKARWREDFPIDWENDNYITRREMVKFQAAQAALNMTRLLVMRVQGPREWAERPRG